MKIDFRLPLNWRQVELSLVLSAAIFLVLFALADAWIAKGESLKSVLNLRLDSLLILVTLTVLAHASRIWRWRYVSKRLRAQIPLTRSILYYESGAALAMSPGKLGELIRLWFLRRQYGLPYYRTLPIALVDRLTDITALLIFLIAGLLLVGQSVLLIAIVAGGIIAGLVLARFGLGGLLGSAERACRGPGRLGNLRRLLRIGLFCLRMTLGWQLWAGAIPAAFVAWALEGITLYVVLQELGSPIGLLSAVSIFASALLFGAVTPVAGGVGSTELAMATLLISHGVAAEAAIGATAIVRVVTLWLGVASGFCALAVSLRITKLGPGRLAAR